MNAERTMSQNFHLGSGRKINDLMGEMVSKDAHRLLNSKNKKEEYEGERKSAYIRNFLPHLNFNERGVIAEREKFLI